MDGWMGSFYMQRRKKESENGKKTILSWKEGYIRTPAANQIPNLFAVYPLPHFFSWTLSQLVINRPCVVLLTCEARPHSKPKLQLVAFPTQWPAIHTVTRTSFIRNLTTSNYKSYWCHTWMVFNANGRTRQADTSLVISNSDHSTWSLDHMPT